MTRPSRCLLGSAFIVGAGLLAATKLSAQELRGLVMTADGVTPASGVVAVLMHSTIRDSIVARGVTNDRGRFSLKVPALLRTNLRLLRIGFEPVEGGSFVLEQGETRDAKFTLHENRIRLATFDVKSATRCQVQPTGAQLVAQLFQQARTALIASTTPLNGIATARSVDYERQQTRKGKLLRPLVRTQTVGETVRPYASIGVDALQRVGYVVADGPDFNYYAPDADVLLSDKFLAQHCLHLMKGMDSLAGSIGIGFRPITNRPNLVDVQGTLWLDKATSELQFLEYTYTSLPDYDGKELLGGRVEYARLPNGGWFVNRWHIRMPILAAIPSAFGVTRGGNSAPRVEVSALQLGGGEVHEIRVDDQVLFLNANALRAGEMPGDDPKLLAADRDGAGVRMESDGATVRSLCGAQVAIRYEGVIAGRVLDEKRAAFAGAFIKAEWKEDFRVVGGAISWRNRDLSTTSSSTGSYLLCGAPTRRTISVFASRTAKFGHPTLVQLTEASPIAELALQLDPPPSDGGRKQ